MRKRIPLLLFFVWLGVLKTQAQINLAGIVTDEKEQPLAGVTIVIRNTNTGTITQDDGQFTLRATGELPLTISVSFIGYQQKNVQVRGNNFRHIVVELSRKIVHASANDGVVVASRVEEAIQKAPLTVEKLNTTQFQQVPAVSPFGALHYVKGVDLMTQSLTFQSVNLRGFGSTANSRFLQLNDGMDNRSPGLGFGFGTVAGIPDLDVEHIELVAGAASALYGPDAEQGVMLTSSKNPFTYQGLSVRAIGGVNNVGKAGSGPKPYRDFSIRYARELNERLAFKVNFQRLDATDFIADNYDDRQTRDRTAGYQPNNNPNVNFQYDGVNRYGDEFIGAGSAYTFPANYANVLLQNKLVTRTGYTEVDLIGQHGKTFNNRADALLNYRLPGNIEASVGWYYGNGNFIRTANFREYIPDYQRHQVKAEIRGDNFFLRAYTTQQKAEGWNIGLTAVDINNSWKSLGQWAAEFGQVYVENKVTVGESRATADRNRYIPGSGQFNFVRDLFSTTYNTDSVPGYGGIRGTRFRDNSALWHYEGMYNLTGIVQVADVVVGGSMRQYALNTGGTLFALKPDGTEYSINEYGGYIQASREIAVGSSLTVKPTVVVRYDKNQYLKGVFSPRASAVVSLKQHHFRASWQSAFHNPVPGQLFASPAMSRSGEVGGLPVASQAAMLFLNPAYLESDVKAFREGRISAEQLQNSSYTPSPIQTEQLKTWEVGYKALLWNKLSVDALYFHSYYSGFISTQTVYQPTNGQLTDFTTNAYRTLQISTNSSNDIFVDGWAIGGTYNISRGFTLSGNYAHQVGTVTLRNTQGAIINDNAGNSIVKRKMSDSEVLKKGRNYFNSPENRYTVSLENPQLTTRLGAFVSFRWTDRMWYEQEITAGDVWLPSWSSLDAQVSYKMPLLKSVIKLGGTNILNKYYAQGYGLAQIGGLYYLSVTFDDLFK
ncbi:carboxypeptidase-like regulatory domain-containing protein [Spirosoma spitsbergense]|uniref:carboxypeptidase-like regulatory domain-containing protein n=1 Tax=Spirosoma spitsbergense TaxID=431554 RepID=UPI00036F630A|nr:carboxypeptidase-like regulatory domain-containing protein [Spirosoma spitsbergense]